MNMAQLKSLVRNTLAITILAVSAAFSGSVISQTTAKGLAEGSSERARTAHCTDRTIRGSYGFFAEGNAGPPTIPAQAAGPLAGVGTAFHDGRGNFTLTAVRSVNGAIDPQPVTLTGRYAVNQDCTLTFAFDAGLNFWGVIVEEGKEIFFVETDPGTTVIVRSKRL
jgi:hypothetical protein